MPGTLLHSPADIVRRVLIAASLGTDPPNTSWPIYAGSEPDSPDSVITIYDTTGVDSGRTAPDRERQEHHGIQVRIRAPNHRDGYVKSRAIAVGLDTIYQSSVTIDGTTYLVHSITRTSDVIPLGKEAPSSKRRLFTINALVMVRIDS